MYCLVNVRDPSHINVPCYINVVSVAAYLHVCVECVLNHVSFCPSQIDPKVAFPRRTQPKVRQLKLFSLLLFHLSTLTRLHSDPFSADCSAALHWLEAPFDSVSALSVTGHDCF